MTGPEVLKSLSRLLGSKIQSRIEFRHETTFTIQPEDLREVTKFCRDEMSFDYLIDISSVDNLGEEPRFEVVYQILSRARRVRLRIRVPVPESDPSIESLTPIWRGANFMEREVWDLFGIRFIEHPDLRRVLLYEEFRGHPLRKDYPVNLVQPRVPERKVEGTFVDEQSHNKLMRLKKTLGSKH